MTFLSIRLIFSHYNTDEATSALDLVTRHTVFSAIRSWRKGKTTVVITHDLNLIDKTDFVYIMEDGRLAEQGYCNDLEAANTSLWKEMRQYSGDIQEPVPYGWAPEITLDTASEVDARLVDTEQETVERRARHASKHASVIGAAFRPPSGFWMLDAIADLTRPAPEEVPAHSEQPSAWQRESRRLSTMQRQQSFHTTPSRRLARPTSIPILSVAVPELTHDPRITRRSSLQFTPTSPTFKKVERSTDFNEKGSFELSPTSRPSRDLPRPQVQWNDDVEVKYVEKALRPASRLPEKRPEKSAIAIPAERRASLLDVTRLFWPTIPQKWLIVLGAIASVLSGAMTPIFSFLFSQLLVTVGQAQTEGTGPTTRVALFVLLVAFGNGLFAGLKYSIMEIAGFNWITSLRRKNFPRILSQDKKWFDEPANTPERIAQVLMKDGEDARALIVTVLAQFFVVTSMLSVGFIWALILGWQLTLAGLAIAPVFAVIMALQARLMSKVELRNKRLREEVARRYHDVSFSCSSLTHLLMNF